MRGIKDKVLETVRGIKDKVLETVRGIKDKVLIETLRGIKDKANILLTIYYALSNMTLYKNA